MCVGCHLAPGIENSEIRVGLYPKPPVLSEARGLNPGNAFWIIKHGIKMSAMPAWGATHDDDSIWAMVAFVQEPARPVHHPAMRAVRNGLHAENGAEKQQDADRNAHGASL